MWQLKVREIKEAWETKKLGFVRILNERKIVFGELVKIVSYWKLYRRILFSKDSWPRLLERFGFVDIGLGQNRPAYFADAFFVVSMVALHRALSADSCNPRWGCTEELGALAEVWGSCITLTRGLETAKCLVGLILSANRQPVYKRSALWPESSPEMTREEFSSSAAALAW